MKAFEQQVQRLEAELVRTRGELEATRVDLEGSRRFQEAMREELKDERRLRLIAEGEKWELKQRLRARRSAVTWE